MMSHTKLAMTVIITVLAAASAFAGKKKGRRISPQVLAKKKLQSVYIIDMKFEKTPVSQVLKKFADRSKEADPDSKGFQFILPNQPMKITAGFGKPERIPEPTVTAKFKNIYLGKAIDEVCKQTKLQWTLMPGKIIIRPETTAKNVRNKATLAMQKRLKSIIIPTISFEDTPMPEALDHIAKQTKKLDLDSEGVDFYLHYYPDHLISPGGDLILRKPGERKLTVDFDNLPLADALRYISRLKKVECRVQGNGVHIYR